MSTLTALALATILGLLTPHILTALPAPRGELVSPYRSLATARVAAWVAGVSACMTLLVLRILPPALWPLWLVLTTIGALAICIDELTCWLPKHLTHTATVLMLIALGIQRGTDTITITTLGRSVAGGAGCWVLFWLIWKTSHTMGYGDVRLAGLCGLASGLIGWPTVLAALLAGTILPVVFALISHRGAKTFPYGPGLLLGALLAALLTH